MSKRRRRPKLTNRELEQKIDEIYDYIARNSDMHDDNLNNHVRKMHEEQALHDRIQELENENAELRGRPAKPLGYGLPPPSAKRLK